MAATVPLPKSSVILVSARFQADVLKWAPAKIFLVPSPEKTAPVIVVATPCENKLWAKVPPVISTEADECSAIFAAESEDVASDRPYTFALYWPPVMLNLAVQAFVPSPNCTWPLPRRATEPLKVPPSRFRATLPTMVDFCPAPRVVPAVTSWAKVPPSMVNVTSPVWRKDSCPSPMHQLELGLETEIPAHSPP